MVATVIAGCSRGLGLDLFEHYSSKGLDVVGCARSFNSDDFRRYECDLCDEKQVQMFLSDIVKRFGEFRLIITAGVNAGTMPIAIESPDVLQSNFHSNFLGPITTLKVAQKYALLGKCKSVVFTSSLAVTSNINGSGIYAACKAGVEKLISVCVSETRRSSCNFNVVRLGYYETDSAVSFGDRWLEEIYSKQLVTRPVALEEVATVIDFLTLSAASRVVNGQTIMLCHHS